MIQKMGRMKIKSKYCYHENRNSIPPLAITIAYHFIISHIIFLQFKFPSCKICHILFDLNNVNYFIYLERKLSCLKTIIKTFLNPD